MLRPKILELEGFRSFSNRSVVHFPDAGAVLINGRYSDNTTSSGSGKSSILIAMAFALGFCDIPVTKLKNWSSSKTFYVKLVLTDGVNTYEIIRDPKLKLLINGNEVSDPEDQLLKIIRTSSELTKSLTYRPQKSSGKFINSTDSGTKELLSSLLNLNDIEIAHDDLSSKVNELGLSISSTKQAIDYLNQSLQSLFVPSDTYDKAVKDLENATNRLNSLLNIGTEKQKIHQEIQVIDQELAKIKNITYEVTKARQQNQSIKSRVESLTEEIKTLKKNICHTCLREWDNTGYLVDKKQTEINQLVDNMKSNMVLINNSKPLIDESYYNSLTVKRGELCNNLGQLSAPLNDAERAKQLAQSNLNIIQTNITKYKKVQCDIVVKQQELELFEKELPLYSHAAALISRGGFLGSIFDEVLKDIESRSNELMSFIPNINTFTLNLSSSTVTQAGKVNKKIEKTVYKDGKKVPIEILSGGQKTSIELCTDLAFAESIRRRSGSNLGWVALDEAMDGLGVETKLSALNIIKSKINGLLIIVDHSTEIKEIFDKVIEVTFDGRESKIN